MRTVPRFLVLLVVLIAVMAACNTPAAPTAPIAVPTEPPIAPPPSATATPPPTNTPLPPTATAVPPTNTPMPTDTPTATSTSTKPAPTKVVTPQPTATKKVTQPPLADAIHRTLGQVESLGGALDRLYGGSGAEACAPFMADYNSVVGAPQYDVSAQPANVQGAYASYRQAVSLIGEKVDSIAGVCRKGGGVPSRLSFDVARMAINDAGSMLTNAYNMIVPQ